MLMWQSKVLAILKKVNNIKEVTSADKVKYVNNSINKSLVRMLSEDKLNIDGMNKMAKATSALTNNSMSGAGTEMAHQTLKNVSSLTSIKQAKSAEAVLNNLAFAVKYKTEAGFNAFTGLTEEAFREVSGYYNELKERQKSDKNIKDTDITSKVKTMAVSQINVRGQQAYQESKKNYKYARS